MPKIIICRGLPGSGKTTWAKDYVQRNIFNPAVRVNRDDIRKMLAITYNTLTEEFVKGMERDMITNALNFGFDVVVDDTNIYTSAAELIVAAIEQSSWETVRVEFKSFFDTPIETCEDRQMERSPQERVPDYRIRQLMDYYEKYGKRFENYLKRSECVI